jgi:branched-subunit amino acid transport protein
VTWVVVAAVASLCVALRVAAPLVAQRRSLPPSVERRLQAAIPALLAALVALQLFTHRSRIGVDARAVGTLAAILVFLYRRSLVLALVVAAAVTAIVRAAGA